MCEAHVRTAFAASVVPFCCITDLPGAPADLSWDIIARFGDASLPRGFFDDFVAVAEEECKHHLLLKARTATLQSGCVFRLHALCACMSQQAGRAALAARVLVP